MVAIAFTVVAVYFDYLVWLHCKDIDLYGDKNADDADDKRGIDQLKRRKSTVAMINVS